MRFDESFNGCKTAVSMEDGISQSNAGAEARTMASILARYNFYIISTLALYFLLAVVEQTRGQSSSKDTISPSDFSGWGIGSLYHMKQGIRGAASCATSSCHGGPKAGVSSIDAPRGSEYPLWLESDPHSRSWKTISSEASVRILTKLGILRNGKIANVAAYQNCLACHNTDRNVNTDSISPRIAEGVGCESCHGPAEPWYDRHYQGPASAKTAISNLGLTDSGPLVRRAKVCAMCHVGSRDRDMNHDMIAAGHPALYFDMAVYHEAYPKHWRDNDQSDSNFRSRLWLAGQIAMADSELELLESRACKSLPISTWPELSNYQCNSCHSTLNGIPKAVESIDRDLVVKGRAPIRNWNLAGISSLSRSRDIPETDIMKSTNELRVLLHRANPDPKRVIEKTRKLRVQLYDAVYPESNTYLLRDWSRGKQTKLSVQLLEEAKQSNSWEIAASAYTATWATHVRGTLGDLELAMKTMRSGLLFPNDRIMPNFPRSQNERTPPTLKEWNDSLQDAVTALTNEVRR